MIHLDTYLENFESKLEEIQNSIVFVKSYKKPKIRITRLSEERKFVPVELDIEINENLVIKDRFDWNLNDENVCIEDFVNELCDTLNLPEINRTRLKSQLIYQLIDYIERNTYYPRQKNKDQKNDDDDYIELNSDIKEGIAHSSKMISSETRNSGQYKEQEEEQKKTARQRKLDEMKRSYSSTMQPMGKASYIRDKRNCKNCNYVNTAPSFECKKCRVAFYIMEMLDFTQWRVAQAVQYYEIVVSYFPLLGDYVKDYTNFLSVQDFSSIYSLKIAFRKLFPTMKELSEDNIRIVHEKLDDIFANFLVGIVIYRQQEEILPQKRRGRKPKSWYEDQEKRKKEKRERKERGEIVSSDEEDEDDSDEDDDIETINKRIIDAENAGSNQNASNIGAQKETGYSENNQTKDDDNNAGGEEDGGDSASQGSLIIRRGRGRPPKKLTYQGKKRGRKPKNMSESLIRASSKNIDLERENDEEEGDSKQNDGEENNMDSEGEMNEEDQEQKTKKKDQDKSEQEQMEEESNEQDSKNADEQLKIVKNDLKKQDKKSRKDYLDDEDDEQFDVDDEDDEDYGGSTIKKSSTGKRGRPPKNKLQQQPGKRGRKPLPKKELKGESDEMKPEIDEESQSSKNAKDESKMEEENIKENEKQSPTKILQKQSQSKIYKKKMEDEEASEKTPDQSDDENFSLKKLPIKTSRRGRPRKEEQKPIQKEEKETDQEEDDSNVPSKKQNIIKKQLRTRFTRHQQHHTNSEEDNDNEDNSKGNKVSTRKSQSTKKQGLDKSESDINDSDEDYDRKQKQKEIKKKEKNDDQTEEDEEIPKKGKKQQESNDNSVEDEDEGNKSESEQNEDDDNQENEDEEDNEIDDDQEENSQEDDDEDEEDMESGVRTRRSQRTQSNDSNQQKKKEIPKSKKIMKSSNKSDSQDAPRKKGRPPKKVVLRGRKK